MNHPSLLDHWYALGPEDRPFSPGDPAWAVHRVVEDDPASPTVTVENPAGQRFPLERAFAASIALAPGTLPSQPAGRATRRRGSG